VGVHLIKGAINVLTSKGIDGEKKWVGVWLRFALGWVLHFVLSVLYI
jgi:hypothetical protein